MWYLQCFFFTFFSKTYCIILPVYFTNRWNENMAVKRDVQYIMTCDRRLKKRIWFKNIIKRRGIISAESDTARVPQTSAPYISVYDLKLHYHSTETTALPPPSQRPDSSYLITPSFTRTDVAMPFLQTEHVLLLFFFPFFLAQRMTTKQK